MTDIGALDRSADRIAAPQAVLAALGDILGALTRPGFDLAEVLQIVIERAVRLCGADMGNIATRQGEVYRIAALVGMSDEYARIVRQREYVPERASIVGRALLQRGVAQIADVLEDPEYKLTDAQRIGGFRTLLGVPMLQDDEAIGALALGRPSGHRHPDRHPPDRDSRGAGTRDCGG